MRMVSFLMFVVCLQVAAKTTSQTVSFSGKDVSVREALTVIEKQTGYFVFYSERDVLTGTKPVSLVAKNMPLRKFLDEVLKGQGIVYEIKDRTIVVRKGNGFVGEDKVLAAGPIRGRVLDSVGRPLAGATVTVKKSKVSEVTDAEGVFSLNVTEGDVLLISFVGYETRAVIVTSSMFSSTNNLVITLRPSITKLEEIEVSVNTGYQKLKLNEVTGSVVQLDNEIINRKVSANIFDRITELVPGLNFNPNRGSPFNRLQIRGISTLTANQYPLFVVDGFSYDNLRNSNEFNEIYNYINNINPNDVESITVLKDASAASIWGARSGNGVIVITTKRGKYNQKTSIRFNSSVTIGEKPRLEGLPLISSADIIEFEKSLFSRDFFRPVEDAGANFKLFGTLIPPVYELLIAKRDGKITADEADARIEAYAQHDVRKDINKYLHQNSINQQYAFNISGGSTSYNYYTSIGYDQNAGDAIGNESKRFSLRFDNNFRPIKKLTINTNLVFTQTKDQRNGISYLSLLNGVAMPIYNMLADAHGNALPIANGLRTFFTENTGNADYLNWQYRPLEELRNNDNVNEQLNIRLGGKIKYSLFKGFNLDISGIYERGNSKDRHLHRVQSFFTRNLINQYMYRDSSGMLRYPIPNNSILDYTNTELEIWSLRGQIDFNRRFNSHEVNAIIGTELREAKNNLFQNRAYGYDVETGLYTFNPDFINPYRINPDRFTESHILPNVLTSGILNRILNYYANAVYTYRDKYTLSASVRRDGANLFGVKPNKLFYPFWSAGFLWNIYKEKFYKINCLPELRMRVSYGFNGNMRNDISTYATMSYDPIPAMISGFNYGYINSPPLPSLRWERLKTVNLGLDFMAAKSRLTGSIEYYIKNGSDLISDIQIDPTSYLNSAGSSIYTGNGAGIKGKGIDLSLNIQNIHSLKFTWSTTLLLAYNSEKITSLGDSRLSSGNNGIGLVNGGGLLVGMPRYSIYSFQWTGLNPINGDPMGYVNGAVVPFNAVLASVKGVPNTKPQDMRFHGPSNPKYWGVIRNSFRYKQSSISANILFKAGHYFRRPSVSYSGLYSNTSGHTDYLSRWQKPGDELLTNIPSLPNSGNVQRDQFYQYAEILVERADHIRLQDIRVDYTLNRTVFKKLPFQKVLLYGYANNLGILWTANHRSLDPENNSSTDSVLPSRMLTFGVLIDL